MKVYLQNNNVYQWQNDNHYFFKGYFIVEEVIYRGMEAIQFLSERINTVELREMLHELNGSFCFIIENEKQIICAVDRLRSLPLFYSKNEGDLQIGDDVEALVKNMPFHNILDSSEKEYISSGLFVTGNKTLLEGLYQVEAGMFCVYEKETNTVTAKPYFQMNHGDFVSDFEELEQKFWQAYKKTAKHLVMALNGRTAVIPLSGGADSRMVLTMLKMEGYEKVICYTYGRKNNQEAEISRQVAKEYGYPWLMITYTSDMWKSARRGDEMQMYKDYAFAFTSTPHLSDYLAVKEMKEKGLIPRDGVFVPGHSGDLIAGSHITREYLQETLSRKKFLETVYKKFFVAHFDESIRNTIEMRFSSCKEHETEKMASWIEWFNIQERQAKFIVNSVRAYEFFGYEWLVPLWDNCLFEFWKCVPIEWRYQRKLYFTIVKSQMPSTNDSSIKKDIANMIRALPGVSFFCRKIAKVFYWWTSPLMEEHVLEFWEYMKVCLSENQFFGVNRAIYRQMLLHCKKKIESYEKE